MRNKVSILEARLDSLEQKIQVLIDKQSASPEKKKIVRTNKKKPLPQIVETSQIKEQSNNTSSDLSVSEQTTTYRPPATSSGVSHQCMATTKKGTRCKRMVRNGNYCWQHGG